MAKRDKEEPSDLVAAAQRLDGDLARFEEASESLERLRLNSEKALQKAAGHLSAIVEVQGRMSESMQALMVALNAARERQETQSAAAQRHAKALQERTAVFQS